MFGRRAPPSGAVTRRFGTVAQRLEQGTHNPLVACSNHAGPIEDQAQVHPGWSQARLTDALSLRAQRVWMCGQLVAVRG